MRKFQSASVSGFIWRDDKKFLLVRRAENDTFPGKWELPGGGVDYAENPKQSIKREVKEETGLTVDVSYPLGVIIYFIGEEKIHTIDIAYLCKVRTKNPTISLSSEHSDFSWVSFSQGKKFDMTPLMSEYIEELEKHTLIR